MRKSLIKLVTAALAALPFSLAQNVDLLGAARVAASVSSSSRP